MITPIRSLTLLFMAIANLFANTDAFSIEIDRIQLVREMPHPRSLRDVISFNNKAFFLNSSPNGLWGLWISDGTATGTKEITSIPPSYQDWHFLNVDGQADTPSSQNNNPVILDGYFYFWTDNNYGLLDIWKSNGTAAGTMRVKQTDADGIVSFVLLNDIIYLLLDVKTGWSYHRFSLWRTDGTAAGTWELSTFYDASDLVTFKGKLYFISSSRLWVSDGTAEGTGLCIDINPKSGEVFWTSGLIVNNNTLYIIAADGLWRSDGTQAGTVMVANINIGAPVALGKYVLFEGYDDVHGQELWRTDGTQNGTILLEDLEPGTASSSPLDYFTALMNDELYFMTRKGFWKTDGTPNGTKLLKNNLYNRMNSLSYYYTKSTAIILDNKLYFGANFSDHYVNKELWKTDGTSNGTNKVAEFFSVGVTDREKTTLLNNFVTVGDVVLFTETYTEYSTTVKNYKQKLFKLKRDSIPLSVPSFLLPLLLDQ